MYTGGQEVFVCINGEVFQGVVNTLLPGNRIIVYWGYRQGKRSALFPKFRACFNAETKEVISNPQKKCTPKVCHLLDELTPVFGQKVRVHYYDRVLEGTIENILLPHFGIAFDDAEKSVKKINQKFVSFLQN